MPGVLDNVQLRFITSIDDLAACKRWAGERREGPLCFDTESAGLSPYRDECRLIQVGDLHTGWAAPAKLWGGGLLEILREYRGDLGAHNCLRGTEEVITRHGLRSLRDLYDAGDPVELLADDGRWAKSLIHRYLGAQMLRIEFAPQGRRSNIRHFIDCTENHRWQLTGTGSRRNPATSDGTVIQAKQLRIGDRVRNIYTQIEPDTKSDAFIHGLVFADGSHESSSVSYHEKHGEYRYQLRLCGAKARLVDLFDNVSFPDSSDPDPWVRCKSVTDFKALPSEDASNEYVASFIEGWQIMDGSSSSFSLSRIVTSASEDSADWLMRNATRGGWACTGWSKKTANGGYKPGGASWQITITKDPDLSWTVKNFFDGGYVSETYCPDVPDGTFFTLASGIRTGNSPYDWRVLNEFAGLKLKWSKLQDTLIACHLYDSIMPHGLKAAGSRMVDSRAMLGEKILQEAMAANHWTWATVPVDYPGYWAYGALDPVLTAHLWKKVGPSALGVYSHAYDLERATVRIAAQMMDTGMMLDVPFIERSIGKLLDWERQALAWLRGEFGITSVKSANQIERALNSVGIPTMVWTKTGQASIEKDTLKLYGNMFPEHRKLIETISWARKTDTIVNTHLRKFLDLRDGDDVIHPTMNTCQARTSRQSVTDPPMQTFDRDVPMIRGAYRPRPGNAFVTVDADQIEARLGAHFSSDPGMIEMFRHAEQTGIDFFRLMAGQIFRADPATIDKTDLRRQVTKNATYAKLYGSGLEKMAATAGVPVEQARPVYTAFGQLYPGPERRLNQLVRQAKAEFRAGRRGYVTTPTGRRLYVDQGKEYAALNYEFQGHAAEILKQGVIDLDAAGLGPYLRLTIHDEVLAEVPTEHAADALATMSRILTDRTTYQVPISWQGNILTERWRKS